MNNLIFSLFLAGFVATGFQIILLRELLIVFYGNELSTGIILGAWLIWGALGSRFGGWWFSRIKNKIKLLALLQTLLGFLIFLTIICLGKRDLLLSSVPGEIIGFFPLVRTSFLLLAPFCILSGTLFPLGCSIFSEITGKDVREITRVYILEALGAVVGGGIVSLFLIKLLPSFFILWIFSILLLLSAVLLTKRKIYLAILILFIVSLPFLPSLERSLRELQWQPFALVKTKNSIYGNLSLIEKSGQISLYVNGILFTTFGDKLTSEEAVQIPLLEHPEPENVLLIGGGIGGPLAEILKHPVKNVDYVELDPMIFEISKGYLLPPDKKALEDQRTKVFHIDGRIFVRKTTRKYDVLILNLPNPYNVQINRFYSEEFFREAKRILKPEGLLSFSVTSAENYINPEQQSFLNCLKKTVKKNFKNLIIIPGDTNQFIASDGDFLTYDWKILIRRLKKRKIKTQFVREYYLPYRISQQRVNFLQNLLKTEKDIKLNKDLEPIGYLYDLILWSTYFPGKLKNILQKLSHLRFVWMLLVPAFILIVSLFCKSLFKKIDFRKSSVYLAVFTTGFSEILFQVVVIVSFQVIYGFLYYQLGLIITAFMLGLVLGSIWTRRYLEKLKNVWKYFIWTQGAIVIYPLLLPLIFAQRIPAFLFSMLPIIAGIIGGIQFPLAAKIIFEKKKEVNVGGILYGTDLAGSFLGAILVSVLLVPLFGLVKTCLLAGMINLSVLLLFLLSQKT